MLLRQRHIRERRRSPASAGLLEGQRGSVTPYAVSVRKRLVELA